MSSSEEIQIGDIVAVNHGAYGRREGLVVGTTMDYAGRQVVEIQFEPGETFKSWHPYVRRVRRTISYNHNQPAAAAKRTIERLYW